MVGSTGQLRQVSLTVSDVDSALAFYEGLLQLRVIARPGALAFLDLGGVRLMLTESGGPRSGNSVLYFVVEDLVASRTELEARGVRFVDQPHVIFEDATGVFGAPGYAEWMTFFEDPDGNLLALSARVASARHIASP